MAKFPDKTFKIVPKNIEQLYKLDTVKASDIEVEEQEWLWKGYIPLNTCTLFAGTGGIGKSQLLLYIASLVSNGSSFKINSLDYKIEKGSILILSAEDSIKSSIVPRLMANNASLEKIHLVCSAIDASFPKSKRFVELDKDLFLIEEKIKEIGDVKLIIIDPITAYLGKVKENCSAEVRTFIMRISEIAEENNLSIILNTHVRKKNGSSDGQTSAADEIMGSSAWHNTVRQAYTISRDHDDKERILFINCKSNCGSNPESFDYKIEEHTIESKSKKISTSRIKLLSGKVTVDADEALNKSLYDKKTNTEEAMDFILDTLKFGSVSAKKIRYMASARDIQGPTLKYARQQLNKTENPILISKSVSSGREDIWSIGICSKK